MQHKYDKQIDELNNQNCQLKATISYDRQSNQEHKIKDSI
jgi:hypothetical protein